MGASADGLVFDHRHHKDNGVLEIKRPMLDGPGGSAWTCQKELHDIVVQAKGLLGAKRNKNDWSWTLAYI